MTKSEAKREKLINSRLWKARTNYARLVSAAKIAIQAFPQDDENREILLDNLMDAERLLLDAIAAEEQKTLTADAA
jgi:hypothetical protein